MLGELYRSLTQLSSSLFCLFEPLCICNISLVPPSSFVLMSLTCVCWMFIEIYFLFFSAFHWEIKLSKANYTESQKFSELEVHFFLFHIGRGQTIRSVSQAFQPFASLMFQILEKESICTNWYHIPVWKVKYC